MQPRSALTGAFVTQPANGGTGFVEGTAAQYTWFVPQDVAGLVGALGGADAARGRLDAFFEQLNAGAESDHAFLGNEPTLLTPALYNWLGNPAAGAAIVRKAMLSLYHPTPGGFPGNDDGGQMSAWWVFGALGLSPSVPGTGVLTLGSPLFTKATLHLAHGSTIAIAAPKAAAGAPYVHAVSVNGAPLSRSWLLYDDLARAGIHTKIAFDLSTSATQSWGTSPTSAPPSFSPSAACVR
jgi:putative alpha-1,2-mannosidase